jgi:hypothetical protein
MRKSDKVYLSLTAVFFAALLSLKILEDMQVIAYHTLAVRLLVPGYVGFTCLYNLFSKGAEKTRFITAALLFAMLAEIINACNLDFGLLFFAVTHTCLTVFHWHKTVQLEHRLSDEKAAHAKHKRLEYGSLAVFAALYIIITALIELNLHEANLEYELVVPIYLLLLSLMAWRSVCTYGEPQSGRIILGSLLFYACDVFILAELTAPSFDSPPLVLLVLSWVTYLPALFLLSTIGKGVLSTKRFPNF